MATLETVLTGLRARAGDGRPGALADGPRASASRQQPKHSKLRTVVQIGLVVGITSLLWGLKNFLTSPQHEEWELVTKWLDSENLGEHSRLFWKAGGSTNVIYQSTLQASRPEYMICHVPTITLTLYRVHLSPSWKGWILCHPPGSLCIPSFSSL